MKVALTLPFDIRATHQLEGEGISEKGIHGHSYRLLVSFGGLVDPDSGLLVDREWAQKIVNTEVVQKLDRSHLNQNLKIPTGENLVRFVFTLLKESPLGPLIDSIEIKETTKNRFLSTQLLDYK